MARRVDFAACARHRYTEKRHPPDVARPEYRRLLYATIGKPANAAAERRFAVPEHLKSIAPVSFPCGNQLAR
jgi:hypothetical protein